MTLFAPWQRFPTLASICLFLAVSGCQNNAVQDAAVSAPVPHPARFLLTFDDGPSLWLTDGSADIRVLSGHDPTLVRPPYWSFDARTQAAYHAHNLNMLLTDISARDGKIWGWYISLRRRSHFRTKLAEVRRGIEEDRLPVVDGVVPVVVTFHDTNDFTANHMTEYLRILVEESQRVGLMALPVAQRLVALDSHRVQEG